MANKNNKNNFARLTKLAQETEKLQTKLADSQASLETEKLAAQAKIGTELLKYWGFDENDFAEYDKALEKLNQMAKQKQQMSKPQTNEHK